MHVPSVDTIEIIINNIYVQVTNYYLREITGVSIVHGLAAITVNCWFLLVISNILVV